VIDVAGPVLAASLLGSPHCAGMCGGFVAFYSAQDGGNRWFGHAAYNGGRLVSYLTLGAVAGAVGSGLDRLGAIAGIARFAAVAAGALMIVWGGITLLRARGVRIPAPRFVTVTGVANWLGRRLGSSPPVVRALLLGLFTTLLPCGWLYAFVATAAGTGSVPGAMVVMAAFWLGTVPILAGLGLVAQRAFGPLRRHLPALTAAAMIVIGLLMVTGRIAHPMPGHSAAPSHQHGGR
jgi:hypothetical protein